MAQVGVAIGAMHFGALHPEQAVHLGTDGVGCERGKIAGPTGAAVIFSAAVKKRLVATDAAVNALGFVIGQLAAKGALGRFVARHVEGQRFGAFGFENCAPFFVGFGDFGCHGVGLKRKGVECKLNMR